MLNQCNFIGRLGNDPEIRHTASGQTVANLSLACSEKYKDKQGQQQEKTEWVRVIAWGRLGEICGEYLEKGSLAYFSGKMETRKWQDQSGNDKYTTEIVAREMKMLGSKGDNNSGGKQQDEPWPDNTYAPNDGTGDEVPF